MSEKVLENKVEEISDRERIANLIVENQMLNHKLVRLAQLVVGASKVLEYYGSTRILLPTFSLVDHSKEEKQPLFTKAKYKIVEVLDTPGPDKEIMVGKEMYSLKFDVETAIKANEQILDTLKELDIIVNDETTEEIVEEKDDIQLQLDFDSIEEENK